MNMTAAGADSVRTWLWVPADAQRKIERSRANTRQ